MQPSNPELQNDHDTKDFQQQKQPQSTEIEGQDKNNAIEQQQSGYNFDKVASIIESNGAESFDNAMKDIALMNEDQLKSQKEGHQQTQIMNQIDKVNEKQQVNKQNYSLQQQLSPHPQNIEVQQPSIQTKQIEGQPDNTNSQKQQKIKQIRQKQQQLLAELKLLKQQQQELLSNEGNVKSNSPIIGYQKDLTQGSHNQQQLSPKEKKQVLSPLKTKKRYSKPKPIIPDPVVPAISRQQFQTKVRQIANNIRLKVHKSNNVDQTKEKPKNKSETKQRKNQSNFSYQSDIIELPPIQNKARMSKLGVLNKLINTFVDNQQAVPPQDDLNPIDDQGEGNKVFQVMESLVQGIIKQAIQRINYKQKYAIKLDPVHHRYPMTVFRKKIIEQNNCKNKEKYNAQSLRQSLLNQRKEIYDKSREKIK